MKFILASLSLSIILFSCGSSPVTDVQEKAAPTYRSSTISSADNKTVANILIEGVHCDGCRGKIKKEIEENECVKMAMLRPSDTPELELAVIEYDPNVCTPETFVDIINSTVDGKYTATDVTVLHMKAE
jgi:copper chaperone CopZ